MSEKNIPGIPEDPLITSVSQSPNSNDVIDLTEISDECEVTSVIVSNDSLCPQQPENNHLRNRRRKISNSKANSEAADDSICILYEKVKPAPEVVVVNEVAIDANDQNESGNHTSHSTPVSPVIMGSYRREQDFDFLQLPAISNETTSTSYHQINYSLDIQFRAPQPSTRSSCQYATANEGPCQTLTNSLSVVIEPIPGHQNSLRSATEAPLNLKTFPPNHGLHTENLNTVAKVPKIQCGICLDGPDEISASGRSFTSTNCGHVFCNTCIKTAMKNVSKCPKCRKKITSRSIHPLYL